MRIPWSVTTRALMFLWIPAIGNQLSAQLIVSGVVDGPLVGGTPKAMELYITADIPDLSRFGVGSANNGNGSNGVEFKFPPDSASAGNFLYVAVEEFEFENFFGFLPDYTSGAMSINGDDAIEVFRDDVVIDIFGLIDVDGSGEPWEHADGWAYRNDKTGPDGSTFGLDHWFFSGPDALDSELTNDTALTPVPIGSYVGGGGPVAVGLHAGDADQDLDFDQFDLIMVQIASKYLSGLPATWGEGDWDGAPGGQPGSPPEGNGAFDQLDIVAALNAGVYFTGPYNARVASLAGGGDLGQVDLIDVPEPTCAVLLSLGLAVLVGTGSTGRLRFVRQGAA